MSLLTEISAYLEIALILLGLFYTRKSDEGLIRAFLVFKILDVIVSMYFAYNQVNNMFMFHLETVVSFIIFSTLLYSKSKLISKRVLKYSILAFLSIEVFSLLTYNDIETFNSISRTISSVWFIALSIFYYYRLILSEELNDFKSIPLFWYVNGIFIYFISNFLLFFTFNQTMLVDKEITRLIWRINSISILVLYVLIIIGLSKKVKERSR